MSRLVHQPGLYRFAHINGLLWIDITKLAALPIGRQAQFSYALIGHCAAHPRSAAKNADTNEDRKDKEGSNLVVSVQRH